MEDTKKSIGALLTIVGVGMLVLLIANLGSYVEDFRSNPIYIYVAGFDPSVTPIKFGDHELVIPKEYLSIVALFFGFMFLKIWLEAGLVLIKSGRDLISDDVKRLGKLISDIAGNEK